MDQTPTPQPSDAKPNGPPPATETPQEFYARITKREDVREILKRLAK
jgi:hypothetical protein